MKEKALYWFGVVKTAITLWLDRSAIIYAGALAFFTLFSIAPVVILAVQVIGLVISTDTAMTQIMEQLTPPARWPKRCSALSLIAAASCPP